MPEDQITRIYTTLLDVQKQIGDVSGKTDAQTEKLISIESQTIKTNGRVTKLEGSVSSLELVNANHAGRSTVRTAIWSAVAGIIVTAGATLLANHLGF